MTPPSSRATSRSRRASPSPQASEGIDPGTILKPWLRTAGQGAYTQGSANVAVQAKGVFAWERRSGKKTYVYFKTVDGEVKSNSVVIAAR